MPKNRSILSGICLLTLCFVGGCNVQKASESKAQDVSIDGSSTVYPISMATAENFQKLYPDVRVSVASSGTGGGFKSFIRGESDINDASRPIKDKEDDACKEAGIEYIELTVAIDGLSVVVHPDNDWCNALTVAQLKKLWEPGSQVSTWKELNSAWPDEKIELYGPDTDSGTFDYFTDVICGEEGASRTDYNPSPNDNILVTGVSGNKYALGYFGYAYYVENQDKLKAIGIAEGEDVSAAVAPTAETINAGKYVPLSRPLFLYVNKASLAKRQVAAFLQFYLNEGQSLVDEVGYVRLGEGALNRSKELLRDATPAE